VAIRVIVSALRGSNGDVNGTILVLEEVVPATEDTSC